MRRIDIDALSRIGLDPSVKHSTAWKDECMDAVIVDDSESKFPIKRCSGYRPPPTVFADR